MAGKTAAANTAAARLNEIAHYARLTLMATTIGVTALTLALGFMATEYIRAKWALASAATEMHKASQELLRKFNAGRK